MQWMAWTVPTALFFIAIVTMLACMLVWELLSPTRLRAGFLPMATTRGDRLFVGLLTMAFVHIAWLGLSDASVLPATVLGLGLMVVIMRWG